MVEASAVDFDDLLLLPIRILQENPDVLERYQQRYYYVLVDEYQDTNHAQYTLARLLTDQHKNLFVVGDEDQSIYSWRGANIQNILRFEKDFPGAQVFRLEENYRSTKPILDAANAVVERNQERIGKNLYTPQAGGEPVYFYEATDGKNEADFVAASIAEKKVLFRETAVLYRTNAQSREIEEALRRKGIPYRIVGGMQFYARKEVKDIIAYLRLLVNPNDDQALQRVINVPPRGIGSMTLRKLQEYATERRLPLLEVMREIEHDQTFPTRARHQCLEFVQLLDELVIRAKSGMRIAELVETLLKQINYRDYVRRSDEKDFRSRIEIVDEFVASCAQREKQGKRDLASFLQELSLLSDLDEDTDKEDCVTLMTCHAAKGLEFDQVFLVGLEEGLLPHANSLGSRKALEEERRLCYVAMTRARKYLTLSAAQSRVIYGQLGRRECSRFVRDIPPGIIKRVSREGDAQQKTVHPVPAPPRIGENDVITVGTRVRHAKFGEGIVMTVSGSGKKQRARIRFRTGRSREFMVQLAPLEILERNNRQW